MTDSTSEQHQKRHPHLTTRELATLIYVAEGYSNKLIGNTLGCSEQTVKNHMLTIQRKLNTNNRAHSVVTAIRKGWLVISPEQDTVRGQ